jgi:NADH-quinone oxidoreductase subunit G
LPIGLVGERADLTYPYEYLGAGPQTLADVASGAHEFGARLRGADRPLVIVGMAALARPDGAAIAALAARAAQGSGKEAAWNGYSVLHTAAARVGALDLGFVPGPEGRNAAAMAAPGALDLVFLLGADEIDIAPGAFVVYIGTHGDAGAHRADVILPGAAYPEKSGVYVNTEGRVQMAGRASFPPGEAREDWAILRALSDVLGRKLAYDSLAQLRQALLKAHPHLQRVGQLAPTERGDVVALAARGGAFEKTAFGRTLDDFYLTNPVARASATMAECSVIAERRGALTAAE